MSDKILVRYVQNATNDATGAIHHDDDRPDLLIGHAGYVTEEEVHGAAAYGVVLAPTDEAELKKLGIAMPADPDAADAPWHDGMNNQQLREVAKDEGADVTGKRSNEDLISAIEDNRAGTAVEGAASLPATATVGSGSALAPAPGATSTATAS